MGGTQNLIVLLLVVLIIISCYHLYLDHFAGRRVALTTKQDLGAVKSNPPSNPGSVAARDSLRVAPSSAAAPPIQIPAPLRTPDMPDPKNVHLRILNGCGTSGVAGRVRNAMRNQGFDVLSFGNAQTQNYPKTVVISHSRPPYGELAARLVASTLGISADQITVQKKGDLGDIDVTVILGADFQKLNLAGE